MMFQNSVQADPRFAPFAVRMQAAGLPDIFIQTFASYYAQLVTGKTGLIPETEIEPVLSLPDVDCFSEEMAQVGRQILNKTAVIKLNGGLGTSMGLEQTKSLLVVKEGHCFLDIIAQQTISKGVPLILMDSFNTQEESLAVLARYSELNTTLPKSFLQHRQPKIRQSDLAPVDWPPNPALEWCPPGHGDIYTALITSGTLDALLARGYEYVFVSNADNLGAGIDEYILGYMAGQQVPFIMEVADRTEMDKKGGHLAQRQDGRLLLRESAQCPQEDEAAFQDITRHRYFNTNNLWFHLPTLHQLMAARDYILGLPIIRNEKTVDPRDLDSTPVYQLETAMGSAISVFAGAQAVRVPRRRFAPVKTTNDLLAVRSDVYRLQADFCVQAADAEHAGRLVVDLDPNYYRFVSDLEARFPHGAPSLAGCCRLAITGDIYFGRDVRCQGEVQLSNTSDRPVVIPDGAVLQGSQRW